MGLGPLARRFGIGSHPPLIPCGSIEYMGNVEYPTAESWKEPSLELFNKLAHDYGQA